MMLEICRDMDTVRQFMSLPEIYKYCAEFGADKESRFTHSNTELWIKYIDNGEFIGLINMHVMTGAMCQFHPYILKKNKSQYNRMIKGFFKWFDDNMQAEAVKLNAVIPAMYIATIRAAYDVGMTREGIDRMSYRHKKRVLDRVMFGITRKEINDG